MSVFKDAIVRGCVRAECSALLHSPSYMSFDDAERFYRSLKPFLRIVEPYGCYAPSRQKDGSSEHRFWPLHSWAGSGRFPLIVEWNPRSKNRKPSFSEWLSVYNVFLYDNDTGE